MISRAVRTAYLIGFLTAGILWSGCDLFQTREPEAPTEGTSGFKPADTPEVVLENLTAAVITHNAEQYVRCFVDTAVSTKDFAFSASGDFQGTFLSWGLEDEQRYFQNMGPPFSGVPSLIFSNLQTLNRTSVSAEFTMEYFLFYPHRRIDVPRQVRGYMHLYLEADAQRRWSVYRWEDARTITDSTWSYLKRAFD